MIQNWYHLSSFFLSLLKKIFKYFTMIIIILSVLSTLFLAYINGANDNFKGVATLYGSATTNYKKALLLATVTTFLGSLTALFISAKLISSFSGKGLLPDMVVNNPDFLISVGLGAALTVCIATRIGIPISTTHSLIGALIGAGLVAAGTQVNFHVLGNKFFLPLLLSPVCSALLTLIIYPFFRHTRKRLGISTQMCLCIGKNPEPVMVHTGGTTVLQSTGMILTIDQQKNCRSFYHGSILGFNAQSLLDKFHYISAGLVSFARGLNDTPKIVALLLVTRTVSLRWGMIIVGMAIAAGGIISAKKVAVTISKNITKMNHGQGFTANLITALLVIFASRWGLPVSTTHVSCGSIFGIGLVRKEANLSVIGEIILAWILTLPLAALAAGGCFLIIRLIR